MHRYEMGLIGNCSFLGLISKDSSVEWMCWPRFDSSYVFGGLIAEPEKSGRFQIVPVGQYQSFQYYIENTTILCTEFECADGSFRVLDFAPRFKQHDRTYRPLILARKIELISGSPRIHVHCRPAYNYGETPEIQAYQASNHLRFDGFPETVRLYSTLPLSFINSDLAITLTEDASLLFSWGVQVNEDIATFTDDLLNKTSAYWMNWTSQTYVGQHQQEAVLRSALTLKLHQYEDTGAIVAATTTSLPEFPGSERNWDYRFCWIRDSYYTLSALNAVSKFDELKRYAKYVQAVVTQDSKRVQPLYSITGEAKLEEMIVPLRGYMGNQPVRVGNQAYTHIQNDVYGQILLSLLPLYVDARFPKSTGHAPDIRLIAGILNIIDEIVDEPDAGLWEFRNKTQQHCYTYLFHWAGAKAAKKIGSFYNEPKLMRQADSIMQRASAGVERCYSSQLKAYAQAVGSENMDASLFQLITMGYIPPESEKALHHYQYLVENLGTGKSLFYRYKHKDDFGKMSASFLVCGFWAVEALAAMGKVDDAVEGFAILLGYANDLGLFSEDIDHLTGAQWGNFPQTYSHVGLINASFRITRKMDRPTFL